MGYRICRNKRPGRLIFRSNKNNSNTHRFYVLPPFEKSPINTHRFYVLPPLKTSPINTHRFYVLPPMKNHPSIPIGFMYSPLWKITVFSGRLFRGGRLFWQIRYMYYTIHFDTNDILYIYFGGLSVGMKYLGINFLIFDPQKKTWWIKLDHCFLMLTFLGFGKRTFFAALYSAMKECTFLPFVSMAWTKVG